jgi:hypothetical protein
VGLSYLLPSLRSEYSDQTERQNFVMMCVGLKGPVVVGSSASDNEPSGFVKGRGPTERLLMDPYKGLCYVKLVIFATRIKGSTVGHICHNFCYKLYFLTYAVCHVLEHKANIGFILFFIYS